MHSPRTVTSSTSSCLKLSDRSFQLHSIPHPSTRSSQSFSGSDDRKRGHPVRLNSSPLPISPLVPVNLPRGVVAEDEKIFYSVSRSNHSSSRSVGTTGSKKKSRSNLKHANMRIRVTKFIRNRGITTLSYNQSCARYSISTGGPKRGTTALDEVSKFFFHKSYSVLRPEI
ncbi:hypothetical protein PFISCL1PPCAC_21306 [Pristionchus fissidentatus]|uniref:Uncharacterized protein n=1 Tax=Pristionchus fissidentatus TaxID=1538716 RepID=A0AAV5WJN7_9BILA|nr:hypothetical protein PFISCL1PPCAC_21306 [Pristionchus fissidentatus]